jgi:DNA (cytosine-5)-methyltransferase 1
LLPNNLKKMQQKYVNRVGAKTRFSRLKKNGLFSTIVTSPDPYWGKFIHPTQNRVISVREAARAQTFRDEIEFSGSVNSKYSQVGNAVPPLMAKAVGEKIRTFV